MYIESSYARGFEKRSIETFGCWDHLPISNSHRVSPVQVVPKKEGITVVSNENNELISMYAITLDSLH